MEFNGFYNNDFDQYVVSVVYGHPGTDPNKPLIFISQRGSFSRNFAIKIDQELEKIEKVKAFKEKYQTSFPFSYNFYKAHWGKLDKDYLSISMVNEDFGVSKKKDYIVIRYSGGGSWIPEDPKDWLYVYIDPWTYRVVQIKEIISSNRK